MGKRLSRYFYEERKAQVLTAAESRPDCSIADLAMMYSVSRASAHSWLKQRQAFVSGSTSSGTSRGVSTFGSAPGSNHTHPNIYSANSVSVPDFVELAITDSNNSSSNSNSSRSSDSVLKKISLTFSDFSLVVEGKVDGSKLAAILQILEERC